jgi:hypothetical protein
VVDVGSNCAAGCIVRIASEPDSLETTLARQSVGLLDELIEQTPSVFAVTRLKQRSESADDNDSDRGMSDLVDNISVASLRTLRSLGWKNSTEKSPPFLRAVGGVSITTCESCKHGVDVRGEFDELGRCSIWK